MILKYSLRTCQAWNFISGNENAAANRDLPAVTMPLVANDAVNQHTCQKVC